MLLRIAVGTYEGHLYGWEWNPEVDNTKLKLNFGYGAHTECIKMVQFMQANQGTTMISGARDEMIRIYNLKKRIEVGTLMQHTGSITCASFFDQTHLLTGSSDKSICIWRVSDWNCVHILGGHKDEVNDLAIHPSGKLALSVSKDKTVQMWNLIKGRSGFIRKLDAEASKVFFSSDGQKYGLVMDQTVLIYNAENGEILCKFCHNGRIHASAFASPDLVVAVGEIESIVVWKVSDGKKWKVLKAKCLKARIKDMKLVSIPTFELPYLILTTSIGSIQIWDLNDLNHKLLSGPKAQTIISGGSRCTCLSACLVTDLNCVSKMDKDVESERQVIRTKQISQPSSKTRVVVQYDDQNLDDSLTLIRTRNQHKTKVKSKIKTKIKTSSSRKRQAQRVPAMFKREVK